MRDPLISVVTPTYNRAHSLGDVYRSLLAQKVEIEWLVVDDGSADNTAEVIEELAGSAPFPVRYERQEHGGKHIAVNRGVAKARGSLVGLLDSDDLLTPTALDRLLEHWLSIPGANGYVGVTGLCVDELGRDVGGRFHADVLDATWHEMVYRYRVPGERWGLLRTDVLRDNPFPVRSGYVNESVVWRQIGRHYRTRYVNEVVRVYRSSGADQLTRRPFAEIAAGAVSQHAVVLNDDIAWFWRRPALFARSAAHLSRGLFHLGVPLREHARRLHHRRARALWAGAVLVGWLAYTRDGKA